MNVIIKKVPSDKEHNCHKCDLEDSFYDLHRNKFCDECKNCYYDIVWRDHFDVNLILEDEV